MPSTAAAQEQSIVVLVNDDPISAYDIEQRERFLAVTTQEQPSAALKKKATDMLIEERLQIQYGRKESIIPDEEEVERSSAAWRKKNNMSAAELARGSRSDGRQREDAAGWHSRSRSSGSAWCSASSATTFNRRRRCRQGASASASSGTTGEDDAPASANEVRSAGAPIRRPSPGSLPGSRRCAPRYRSCANVPSLTKGVQGLIVKSWDQLQDRLTQPARLLVMNAKVGEMTPPTLAGSVIEAYAVCARHVVRGDPEKREAAERTLMEQELGIRAEGLLRDMRQDAFIEYR